MDTSKHEHFSVVWFAFALCKLSGKLTGRGCRGFGPLGLYIHPYSEDSDDQVMQGWVCFGFADLSLLRRVCRLYVH